MTTAFEQTITERMKVNTLIDASRKCADEVRDEIHMKSIPVNLSQIGKHLGILTTHILDIACDGALMPSELDSGYEVVLSSQTSWERRRFSLAHEFGHIILHKLFPKTRDFETRTVFVQPGNKTEERFCDAFAAELLMPHDSFIQDATRIPMTAAGLIKLSLMYQVSVTSAAYRLRELGCNCDFSVISLAASENPDGARIKKILVNFQRSRLRKSNELKFASDSIPRRVFLNMETVEGWGSLHEGNIKRNLYVSFIPPSGQKLSSIGLVTKVKPSSNWRNSS